MPIKEDGGEDGDNEEERHIPISEFNTDQNLLQWRMDALGPRLHGPEKDPDASSALGLNGSQQFTQVYGGGEQAAAFRSRVGENFAFVTNVTLYNQSGGSDDVNIAQSSGREAADSDTSTMNVGQSAASGNGDTPLMPATVDFPAPRRMESDARSSEHSYPSTAAGEARSMNLGSESVSVLRDPPSVPQLSPAAPPPASFPRDGQTDRQAQTGQPALDMAEQGEEMGGEMGGESVLPPPAEPMFIPVMRSLLGRRIQSLPSRRVQSLPDRRIQSLPGRRIQSLPYRRYMSL